MQPISHLPSSKPLHPQNSHQQSAVSGQPQEELLLNENTFTDGEPMVTDSRVNCMLLSHSRSLHAQSCRVYRKVAYL